MNTKFYSDSLKGREHLDNKAWIGANKKMDLTEIWCENVDCSCQNMK
jgi:hypothetical protein